MTAFCRLSGIGLIVIGIGLLITAAILGATDSACSFLAFGLGFAGGLILLIRAEKNITDKCSEDV